MTGGIDAPTPLSTPHHRINVDQENTMSNPVVEAAQRAWAANEALDGIDYNPGEGGLWTPDAMESAAREALAPIRDLHRPFVTNDPRSPHDVVCNHCLGPKVWPCLTARFAYTSEELEER